jgi:hypothetical protein
MLNADTPGIPMRNVSLVFCCLFMIQIASAEDQPGIETVRSAYQQTYAKNLMNGVICVEFSYVGAMSVEGRWITVFFAKDVIAGMLAPRGTQYILLYDAAGTLVQQIRSEEGVINRPLFCKGDAIFLFGRSSNVPFSSHGHRHNGNAIRLSKDLSDYDLYDIFCYGSSGGLEDKIPTEAQRAQELADWDRK